MSSCDGNCSACTTKCENEKVNLHVPCNESSKINKVIAVMSGKGGVGKSTVTSSLAVALQKKGYRVGILDSDITGPSIPKVFGVHQRSIATQLGMCPGYSKEGTALMSINLLMDNEEMPVVWRGPAISGVVKQFWTDVVWDELDYLLIDMPPGTGDVPLTVFQNFPVDGVVIVTTPQDLVSMIVKKSYYMAEKMEIPVLGIIENMSYMDCPDCGKKLYPFGESKLEAVAEQIGVDILGRLPIRPDIVKLCDQGLVEEIDLTSIDPIADVVLRKVNA